MLYLQIASPKSSVLNFLDSNSFEVIISIFQRTEKVPDMERLRYNGQTIRLWSCNTGALDNGFAQNLANKLNVEVYAPTNYLWSTPNGNYFVAGMNNRETFKLFSPRGN